MQADVARYAYPIEGSIYCARLRATGYAGPTYRLVVPPAPSDEGWRLIDERAANPLGLGESWFAIEDKDGSRRCTRYPRCCPDPA